MSSKAAEGAAGLMILAGAGLLLGLIGWVQGIRLGQQSYRITVEFSDAKGMETGAPLRYRGVEIGKIVAMHPSTRSVVMDVEITDTTLRIPSDSVVELQSAAFLGDKSMDLISQVELTDEETLPRPIDPACNPDTIICDGSQLQGYAVPDMADLIRASYDMAQLFTDPLLMSMVQEFTQNLLGSTSGLSGIGQEFTTITQNVSTLTKSLNAQVDNLGDTLDSVGGAADEIQKTAVTAREILEANRMVLGLTLTNFGSASDDLVTLMGTLNPMVQQVEEGELLNNLEVLSGNLRRGSALLLGAVGSLSDRSNIQILQETLDSARMTFQNAQKITTDLDDLTGDAQMREDLRRLVGGLGGLFSRAEQLERQVQASQNMMVATGMENPLPLTNLGSTDWGSWDETMSEIHQQLAAADVLSGDPSLAPSPGPSPTTSSSQNTSAERAAALSRAKRAPAKP